MEREILMEMLKKIKMYSQMVKIRYFEEEATRQYMNGNLPGSIHSSLGQEAVAVGVCSVLREGDYITSTHRGHGHCIAKGAELKFMMAELFGKRTGYNNGKGGTMHIADFKLGILGANGIVGAGIPIATGAALATKLQNKDIVTVCFFGDGASNQGSFHEAINIGAVFSLPIVYVCENNLYAVSTCQKNAQLVADIANRAQGYGIPGKVADGNDVI